MVKRKMKIDQRPYITLEEKDLKLQEPNRNEPVVEKKKKLTLEEQCGVSNWKTVLSNRILLFVLKHGLWTKVTYHGETDKEYTHYAVLAFDQTRLLICYGSIHWGSGETDYTPHKVFQSELGKTWFLSNPEEENKDDN